ncbi:MAG: hypothetical protein Q9170_003448 [Blastenia crenularia]
MLLETLLQKSLEYDRGFNKYSAIGVDLLSSPLPVAVPASASPFLAKLLDKALQTPCAGALRPIYWILSGIGSHFLDALPPSLVARLQEQFKKMLQSIELEDHVANLLCLAVLAVVTTTHRTTLVSKHDSFPVVEQGSLSNVEQPQSFQVARQYFASKRAAKTLDLVVLKVIFACSKSCTLTAREVIESLQLSTAIIEAIDVKDRQLWMTNDRGKFRKLVDKISAYGPQSEVLCAALHFLSKLIDDRPLPQELTLVCKAAIYASFAFKLPPKTISKILLLLDESSIQDQVARILREASQAYGTVRELDGLDTALAIVGSFITSIEYSLLLRQKLLYLLSTNGLAEPLTQFLDSTQGIQPRGNDHDHDSFCPNLYIERLVDLQQKVCILFLKAALCSQQDNLSLDTSLATALLEKKIALNSRISCERLNRGIDSRKPTLVALFEARGTPHANGESQHWRERIKGDLAQNAEHQYQTIVRTMAETCRDLERRCMEVEHPLREEQAKSRQLHDKLEECRVRKTEIESQNHEQSLFLEGIEHEKSELMECVRQLENERDDLSSQVEGLKQALQEASEKAEEATENSTNRTKELELIHAAAMAEKDEELDAQYHSERETKTRMECLTVEIATLKNKVSVTSEEIRRLEAVTSEQGTALERARIVIDQKQAECTEQMELLDGLEAEKKDLQGQLHDLSLICQTLKEEIETRLATIESQSAELSTAHRLHEAELSAQSDKLRQSNEEQIHDLRILLHDQAENAAKTSKESDTKICRLETKVVELKGEIKIRENELEEAQGLTNQVMAFWNKQRRRNASIEEPITVPEDGNAENTRPQQEQQFAMQSRETSPEAKRTRTRQLSRSRRSTLNKVRPSVAADKPTFPVKSTSARQPLQDLEYRTQARFNVTPSSKKSRHTTSKPGSGQDSHDGNNGLEMAEGSFCDSDFFASADQHLVADIHSKQRQETSDDTTMEF